KILRNFVCERDGVQQQVFFWKDGQLCMSVSKYTLLIIPRGFSKTTIASIAVPLYEILFRDHQYFACVSEAGAHAEMQLDNVKRELEGNEQIKLLFGNLRPERSDSEKWRAD